MKRDCQIPRKRRKQIGFQNKWWKLPRTEEKLKTQKTNILGRNLTKDFRELLERTKNSITMTSVKASRMETDTQEIRKVEFSTSN